jgi:hypothetical protein
MDVIQILVFLGIIGWGLFQARTQKQKKPKQEIIYRDLRMPDECGRQ